MARNLDPKCKQCRREGVKLFLKGERCYSSKCAIVNRNYVPGVHGVRLGRGNRMSGFGTQMREKQKAKKNYRILETQFRNYFDKAIKKTGDTGENLYKLLELRLDNVIYRSGFFKSKNLSRQMINHGHFEVNGKKVSIPSFNVKIKDKISIKENSKKKLEFAGIADRIKSSEVPDWMVIDPKENTITIIDSPVLGRNTSEFDFKLITEFYSR